MEGKVLHPNKTDSVELIDKLSVSYAPHIRSEESVKRIMLDVIIAMVPAMIGSVYFLDYQL